MIRIKIKLILAVLLFGSPLMSQLVPASYHDFYIEVNKNDVNCDSLKNVKVIKKTLSKNQLNFNSFSENQGILARRKSPKLYSISIISDSKDTLCVYIYLSEEKQLFFEEEIADESIYLANGVFITRQLTLEIGEQKTGTYFINLNDKKDRVNKRLIKIIDYKALEERNLLSESNQNLTILPDINDKYELKLDPKEYYFGNLIVRITTKGLRMNKISNQSITPDKIEKYLKNPTAKRTKLVDQILSEFD